MTDHTHGIPDAEKEIAKIIGEHTYADMEYYTVGGIEHAARAILSRLSLQSGAAPQSLQEMIRAIYEGLDSEDAALVDREWLKIRPQATPSDQKKG